jgi:hypothetical protein
MSYINTALLNNLIGRNSHTLVNMWKSKTYRKDTLCGISAEFLNVKHGGTVNIELERVDIILLSLLSLSDAVAIF